MNEPAEALQGCSRRSKIIMAAFAFVLLLLVFQVVVVETLFHLLFGWLFLLEKRCLVSRLFGLTFSLPSFCFHLFLSEFTISGIFF